MKMKVMETSLNLRIERGRVKENYYISKHIAEQQLSFLADIYANVEFMDCNNKEYLSLFEEQGYHSFSALDAKGRGILCEIRDRYETKKIFEMQDPHMLHLRIKKGNEYVDLVTIRILVAGGNSADFLDRSMQWKRVLDYIASLPDLSHLVLTGDFNHGVVNNNNNYRHTPRQNYNFQTVVCDLEKNNISLYPLEGYSYQGYMKIDHIATGKAVLVENARYEDVFDGKGVIGIPDHSCIIASICI